MTPLVDTNLLLDVLQRRAPFYVEAAQVWAAVEQRHVRGLVAAISFDNVYYILRKHEGRDKALEAVRSVLQVFTVAPVDAGVITTAAASAQSDFEDAVQAASGHGAGATHVVTRDATGFVGGPLPILTPAQFLITMPARP